MNRCGLTNDILYYYSVFAYDTSSPANFSSGAGVSAVPTELAGVGLDATVRDLQVNVLALRRGLADAIEYGRRELQAQLIH